jgi:CRP/FNR family transcriptional regulator, cyclic AMP receptor protein
VGGDPRNPLVVRGKFRYCSHAIKAKRTGGARSMTTQQSVAALLERAILFGGLAEADRLHVARRMREAFYPAAQTIFARGDAGTDVYLVLEGRVRLSVLSAEGRELSFSYAGPGDLFGEIAALDGGGRTADATAVTPVRAMMLAHTTMRQLVATTPAVASAVIEFLCHRLREADLQLEGVALHRIEVRLARFLLGLVRPREGAATGRGMIDLGMSQGELALLLGASRPKVCAALALLEDIGAIRRRDAKIDCNLAQLRQLAELD